MSRSDHITIRPLETREECQICVRLQREIWGQDFADVVPATILMVSQRVGSVAGGAFDPENHLVGFVFGISGVANGILAHWSHMLAVQPLARRLGLGRRLKLYQRTQLLERGIRVARWSFDPLMALNARFNLNVLGAYPTDYVDNMYGDTGSTLHQGLATDRLVVTWQLDDPGVERRIAGERDISLPDTIRDAPVVLPPGPTDSGTTGRSLPTGAWVRIAVPPDIISIKATDPAESLRWQQSVREAFHTYLKTGYRVVGFCDGSEAQPPAYVLTTEPMSGPDTSCLSV